MEAIDDAKKGPRKSSRRKARSLTKEELASRKLIQEQEAKRRREGLLEQFMKVKATKEGCHARLNTMKINRRWRDILRDAKSEELKRDVDVMSRTFERVVDLKDHLIAALAREVEAAEAMHHKTSVTHLTNLDEFIALQEDHLVRLRDWFERDFIKLTNQFNMEQSKIKEEHEREMKKLQDLDDSIEENLSRSQSEVMMEYQSLQDELLHQSLEERHALQSQIDGLVEELWLQLKEMMCTYYSDTADHQKSYMDLKAKDEQNASAIEANVKKIKKMKATVVQLKEQLAPHLQGEMSAVHDLKEELSNLKATFRNLELDLDKVQKDWELKLMLLTTVSNSAIKDLQDLLLKGEQVLRLAELCSKHESAEECVTSLVSPLTGSDLHTVQDERRDSLVNLLENGNMIEKANARCDLMSQFWKRHDKVLVDKMAREKECSTLSAQNEKYRLLLKQYLHDLKNNNQVIKEQSPIARHVL